MSKPNDSFAFALHGGAVVGRNYDGVEEHLGALASECEALLSAGRSALDGIEQSIPAGRHLHRDTVIVAKKTATRRSPFSFNTKA